jgi:hypothetical protein
MAWPLTYSLNLAIIPTALLGENALQVIYNLIANAYGKYPSRYRN